MLDSGAFEDDGEGFEEDFEVEPQGCVFDVPRIEFEFFVPGEAVSAVDLRPSGDAGHDPLAAFLIVIIAIEVLHEEGAGADEAHVAFENVEERREFVEGESATRPRADATRSRVRLVTR